MEEKSIKLTDDVLSAYLKRYGWEYFLSEKEDNSKVWCTGWQSDIKSFPLNISFTDTWVLFEVDPFIPVECDFKDSKIYKSLLEINNEIQMVKLSVLPSGDIGLKLQVFNCLNYERFSNALGIIAYYADLLYASLVENKEDESIDVLDTYSMIF